MYETLLLLKPNSTTTLDEVEQALRLIAASGGATVERRSNSVVYRKVDGYLQVALNQGPSVLEESREIAGDTGFVDCGVCDIRYEVGGDDAEMSLLNDYCLLLEAFEAMGCFYIFDQIEGRMIHT